MSKPSHAAPSIPVLFFWSQHLMTWRPFFIGETDFGREVFPALLEEFGRMLFDVRPVEVQADDLGPITDGELDQLAAGLPPSLRSLIASDPVGALRVSRSAESSAVLVLYVWPYMLGAWSPLVVALTPKGRELARAMGDHLAELGVHCWLVGVDRDDPLAIGSTARLLAPPPGAFIDPAPDGVIDPDVIGRLGPAH